MTLPRYDPPEIAIAGPFWDAIGEDRIVLPRCSVCGRWQWYPEAAGTDCTDGELVWVDVEPTGTLYSFSEVARSFLPGGRDDVPYRVGMIDLDGVTADGDGPRLVATLTDDPDAVFEVGMAMRARFVDLDGRRHLMFEPNPDPS